MPTLHATSIALDLLASVVAPSGCAACDAPCPHGTAFCAPCAATAERATPDDAGIAAFVYGGAVARAVARMKYERRPDLSRPLGDLLWRAIEASGRGLEGCVVVPVPLHPGRLAERGYNQAALLAGRIVPRLGADWLPLALARARATERQAALGQGARGTNVAGAFKVRRRERLAGRHVLLVDDVRTTGATLGACRDALLDAGAAQVSTAVVARADRDGPRTDG